MLYPVVSVWCNYLLSHSVWFQNIQALQKNLPYYSPRGCRNCKWIPFETTNGEPLRTIEGAIRVSQDESRMRLTGVGSGPSRPGRRRRPIVTDGTLWFVEVSRVRSNYVDQGKREYEDFILHQSQVVKESCPL